MTVTRADCEALDQADPLKHTRERFDLPEGVINLDGNSLGSLPRATPGRLADVARREWGEGLIRSWTDAGWMALPQRVGGRIAPLIGADADEVVAADSTSINYYKLAAAALALRPDRRVIVTEQGDFPTDFYILEQLTAVAGLELRAAPREALAEAIDDDVALLALSHVHYKSGALHDMAALTAKAHAVDALSLWDLSHSAGALEVDLNGAGADLGVGCGYKYLNGGPGAPAFLFVAKRHHTQIRSPASGWIGHAEPFAFADRFDPSPGVTRMLSGTPSVLGLAALEEGVRTFDGIAMAEVRAKSIRLSELFLDLVAARCADAGLAPVCPRDPQQRGSQVSFRHPRAQWMVVALMETGVVTDFRPPDIIRFGFTPLYTRYIDAWAAVERLAEVMSRANAGGG